ncbi:MAG TPA: hypothetical protein VG276_09005 [Actinomycetes bacterium]|nr:hypothetical protein [Actinomycetes bacterium]
MGHVDNPPPSRTSGGAEALEGDGRIDAFLGHQNAFGLLDQHPAVQRRLQLRRQPSLHVRGDRRSEQAGDHPGRRLGRR